MQRIRSRASPRLRRSRAPLFGVTSVAILTLLQEAGKKRSHQRIGTHECYAF